VRIVEKKTKGTDEGYVRGTPEKAGDIRRRPDLKMEEGYFTIEALFLVTLLFWLVLVVMMTGLYICDLNQAKSFLNQRVTELS